MDIRRWSAVLAVTLVAVGSTMTTERRNDRRPETPCPPQRPGVSTRPLAPAPATVAPTSDDDARALVAALLLEGARQGWHAH